MHDTSADADRRRFLISTGALAAGSLLTPPALAKLQQETPAPLPSTSPAAPPTDEPSGRHDASDITVETITEAEKLAGVTYTDDERALIARGIGEDVEGYIRRREFALPNSLAPAAVFDPRLPGVEYGPKSATFVRSTSAAATPLPQNEEDIVYAPVTQLSRWIESRALTSERLTRLYLDRLQRLNEELECVVTFMDDQAIEQARRADRELAAGRYRGPLHGIPWGAKDLFDTKGVSTTWGAEPYQDRVPDQDAAIVRLLDEAGAVLVAKLTLGALAYGDIWFGGRTNNPWNLEQGSSGSSAGSAAATAAGCIAFGIGTETLGSIVSPCMRCGATGLRPTFGRVPRTGAMALCWSLDKIGPICRTVEDCALVLNAINGFDAGDASSIAMPFAFDATRAPKGLRAGYDPKWFEIPAGGGGDGTGGGRRAAGAAIDRHALDVAMEIGLELIEITLPDLPYGSLRTILTAEAAAAFEELTLTNRDDELKWQAPEAWPNTFRQARFIPAIEVIQADRFRRHVMRVMHDLFAQNRLDAIIGPSFAGSMLLITNNTGHPSLTLRSGFREREGGTAPHGFTIWGRLFDEGTICTIGLAMERAFDVWHKRPTLT